MAHTYGFVKQIVERLESDAIAAAMVARSTHKAQDCRTAAYACERVVWLVSLFGDTDRRDRYQESRLGWEKRAALAQEIEISRCLHGAVA